MQLALANVRAILIGIAIAIIACTAFGVLSSFALSNERLAEIVRAAFANNELAWSARTDEDFFTDCALLEMHQLRRGGAFLSALNTRFSCDKSQPHHPCDSLRTMMLGTSEEKASLPAPVDYLNYPFGSRHLEAFVLSIVDFGTAAQLYRLLSYGSVALLFLAMAWRAPATAILLAPIPLFLVYAFSLHRFGGNLAHAPGYFVGFVALAVFVSMTGWFRNFPARLPFAGAIGVIATYFDLLNGVIPTLLLATIVLNHFFYVRPHTEQPGYFIRAMTQAGAIFACFLSAYALVTASRLGLLWLNGIEVSRFAANLAYRLGNDAGKDLGFARDVTFATDMNALMSARHQMTPGGAGAANWVFVAGITAWIFAGLVGLTSLGLRRIREVVFIDVLVLAGVSIGIFAWYWVFAAHTYVHVLFMVRLLALPLACGLAAALIMIVDAYRSRLPIASTLASFGTAALLAVLIMDGYWTADLAPSFAEARFISTRADVVSCAELGLSPDGQPDGVIEVRFRKNAPPLAYVGLEAEQQAYIELRRSDPPGVYHTGFVQYPLGIAREPGGLLLNRRDGSVSLRFRPEQHVYAHYCRDGHDGPGSTYELKIDGVVVPLKK